MRIAIGLISLLLSISAFTGFAHAAPGQNLEIAFDVSAAKYVLEDPVRAEKERDSIWSTFEGYRITKVWHTESAFPLTYEFWDRGLEKIKAGDSSLRERSLNLASNLEILAEKEHQKIVDHLSSYMGTHTSLQAKIYFVAFTAPYAFCVEQNKIGFDVTGHEWHFDPKCLLNTVIHEIFHVGFRSISPDIQYLNNDPENADAFIRFNYAYIQSEGMATYVAYRGLNLFPSGFRHPDYDLLEDNMKVREAFKHLNDLIEQADKEKIEDLNQKAWDKGVMKRAYYVAGAYMCQKIEENFGRERLVDLLRKGSIAFVSAYNSTAPDSLQIMLNIRGVPAR